MVTDTHDRACAPVRFQVDLAAVAANWLSLNKSLRPGADCAAVVKADAYGLGAGAVSAALYDQGCRHFFVAWAEEGMSLLPVLSARQSMAAADRARVYLLNGPWGMAAAEIAEAGLIPVLNSRDDILHWHAEAPAAPAVLQVDTGMNRLGLTVSELADLRLAAVLRQLNLVYVMSHLAQADQPEQEMNLRQRERFVTAIAALGRPMRCSLANSAGIFLGEAYHFDLVRPGAALYGLSPRAGAKNPMRPVVSLSARILQSRTLTDGETIGYGATYRVAGAQKHAIKPDIGTGQAGRYAVLALGYADGLVRALSNRGHVVVEGVPCPIAGRVSMDTVVVDVGGVPSSCGWAEVIGPHQTVDDLAAAAGTIGYEILTSLGRRFRPVYQGVG